MGSFKRGEVVLVDLGVVSKVRPCVVVSRPKPDSQRNMSVVVPMTTEIRGGECEISFPKPPWLRQESVVNVLGIAGVDNARIQRSLAPFPAARMAELNRVLSKMLELGPPPA
jgi:mRNA-degrading endonuclease toxin of MazEF toxin-antitoxin module